MTKEKGKENKKILQHPNLHLAASEWSEAQKLHVACVCINPLRWRNRRELMNNFRAHMRASPNVVLHVCEVQFGDRPFEVTSGENPLDIQLRTKHELWLKENALNLAIARFPAGWRYGAIIDGDFTFTRHDWALEAVHQLQHYDFVQLFSNYCNMAADHRPNRLSSSFAYNYLNRRSEVFPSSAPPRTGGYSETGAFSKYPGAPGGAWAFTNGAFDAVGGLLDTCVLGSGDWHMAFGMIGQPDRQIKMRDLAPGYTAAIDAWQERAYQAIQGNIGCVDCHAVHHWHGSMISRYYGSRDQILMDNHVDPRKDLLRDWQGLYQLTPQKPRLRDDIRAYFRSRNEDSPEMKGHEKHLV